MFERFTDRARKVMALANYEAQRLNHEYIGAEHILLGLVKEGTGAGANVLISLGVDLLQVQEEVEKLLTTGLDEVAPGKLPQTPGAKNVVVYAIEEARKLNQRHVGTEHFLLGLLRQGDGPAAQALKNLGVTEQGARAAVLKLAGTDLEAEQADRPVEEPSRTLLGRFKSLVRHNEFERFTDRARKVMALANQEAQRFNHQYIGTEHILLGLAKEGSGVGANVLKNLDIDLRKVRVEVEKLVKSGPDAVAPGRLPQTPRAKRVIQYAIEESRSLNHNYVGTEHILLGLLREHDGVAAQVLMNLGFSLEQVRTEVLNLLGAGVEAERASPSEQRTGQAVSAPERGQSRAFRFEWHQADALLGGAEIQITAGTGLVLLQQGTEFQTVLEEAIRPAMKENGVATLEADALYRSGATLPQLWEHICHAELIVADLSGQNPDVMFALGLCLGLHRCPILLAREAADLPFNGQGVRSIQYEASAEGVKSLRRRLAKAVREFLSGTRQPPP